MTKKLSLKEAATEMAKIMGRCTSTHMPVNLLAFIKGVRDVYAHEEEMIRHVVHFATKAGIGLSQANGMFHRFTEAECEQCVRQCLAELGPR